MKAIQKLMSDVNKREKQFASDIAQFAAELEPLPNDRDTNALESAWAKAVFSRGKLETGIKHALRHIDPSSVTELTERVALRQLRSMRKELEAARSRLQLWGRAQSIVSAQLLSEPRGLFEDDLARLQEVRVVDQVVNLSLASLHRVANPTAETQAADVVNRGCHRDVPSPIGWFSEMIGAAYRICLAQQKQKPLRFLDVGSGGGTKVLAATTCFDVCDGLEYDASTVATGRRFLELLAPLQCKLIHGDALKFSGYGEYDVIYYYRPLIGAERTVRMEERIFDQAGPGTVLIAVGEFTAGDLQAKGIHSLANKIYITGMSEAEASEICKTAERMGTMVPGFERTPVSNPGYWTPLLEVSARNGYYF